MNTLGSNLKSFSYDNPIIPKTIGIIINSFTNDDALDSTVRELVSLLLQDQITDWDTNANHKKVFLSQSRIELITVFLDQLGRVVESRDRNVIWWNHGNKLEKGNRLSHILGTAIGEVGPIEVKLRSVLSTLRSSLVGDLTPTNKKWQLNWRESDPVDEWKKVYEEPPKDPPVIEKELTPRNQFKKEIVVFLTKLSDIEFTNEEDKQDPYYIFKQNKDNGIQTITAWLPLINDHTYEGLQYAKYYREDSWGRKVLSSFKELLQNIYQREKELHNVFWEWKSTSWGKIFDEDFENKDSINHSKFLLLVKCLCRFVWWTYKQVDIGL